LFFWEHEGNRAVRQGDWKLVALHKNEWELYNLRTDPLEKNNLIKQEPEIASDLLSEYERWSREHGVRAWPLKASHTH
jgi:arylsulfatase